MRPFALLGTTRVLQPYRARVYRPNFKIVHGKHPNPLIRLERFQDFTMTKTLFTTFVSILAFIRALSIIPASAQETAGQILAKLEKLSAEDRQKVLVERARSEKEITFYGSLWQCCAAAHVEGVA